MPLVWMLGKSLLRNGIHLLREVLSSQREEQAPLQRSELPRPPHLRDAFRLCYS